MRDSLCSILYGVLKPESREGRLRLRAGRTFRCEKGTAMVEFALVLPVLLLVMTGIFSFGIVLNNYLELTDAVAVGAQQLAIQRGASTDPCSVVASAINNAAPYLSSSNIQLTFVLNGTTYGPYTGTAAATCPSDSVSDGAAGDLKQGKAAQVSATYPCTLGVYGYNFGCNLHAQLTEIVQ